jgi:hypothetical protein
MTPNDDIPGETPATSNQSANPRTPQAVGAGSEIRGGPEAPRDTLDADQLTPPDVKAVPDGMPGERAALPEGSLPDPFLGPQGDENRDPPANAPAPTFPAETVDDARRSAGGSGSARE